MDLPDDVIQTILGRLSSRDVANAACAFRNTVRPCSFKHVELAGFHDNSAKRPTPEHVRQALRGGACETLALMVHSPTLDEVTAFAHQNPSLVGRIHTIRLRTPNNGVFEADSWQLTRLLTPQTFPALRRLNIDATLDDRHVFAFADTRVRVACDRLAVSATDLPELGGRRFARVALRLNSQDALLAAKHNGFRADVIDLVHGVPSIIYSPVRAWNVGHTLAFIADKLTCRDLNTAFGGNLVLAFFFIKLGRGESLADEHVTLAQTGLFTVT